MQKPAQWMSVEEYLAMEERSEIRHEYVNGVVYAMSGASCSHNLLVTNLSGHAWQARATHACRIFPPGMKVRVIAGNSFRYPDLVGCCDSTDGMNGYLERPCFLIEVLSPSTAGIDRREKLDEYLTIPCLDEYVIVDQDRMHVSVYRRASAPWATEVLHSPDDVLKLTCIRVGIALEDIYEGVECSKAAVPRQMTPDAKGVTCN